MINQSYLKQHLLYNPETGYFFRRNGSLGRSKSGIAGSIEVDGYRRIKILNQRYLAHRLAWLYMTGEMPNQIDHINGDRDDNRFINLRNTDQIENMRNKALDKRNKFGITGFKKSNSGNWEVSIQRKYLGSFSDFFEACCVRKAAEIELNFHKNHGRKS